MPANSGCVSQTVDVTHVYADGSLGKDSNNGQQTSSGGGGAFNVARGVVTFTGTGASWKKRDVGKLITINYAKSPGNNISALITAVPAANQVSYANPLGVAEALPASGRWAVSNPKKTLQAVFDLVPDFVKHNTCVHLSGVFDNPPGATSTFARTVGHPATLLVDGGTATTSFADNAGSPWTADNATPHSVELKTAGWLDDAYMGYLVEILSGPATGQTRMIQGNTKTTITPCRNFSTSPGVGAKFRVVRPKTTFSGADYWIHVRNDGAGGLRGGANFSSFQFQSLYLEGQGRFDVAGSGYHHFSHIVSLTTGPATGGQGAIFAEQAGYLELTGHRRNPFTFLREAQDTNSQAGWGQPSSPPDALVIYCRTAHLAPAIYQSAIAGGVLAFKTQSVAVAEGSRIGFLGLVGTPQNMGMSMQPGIISGSPGKPNNEDAYAVTRFGGRPNRPGIYLLGSSASIGAVEIDAGDQGSGRKPDNAGIELDNSHLYICGPIKSPPKPKQRWGACGHSMSVIHVREGVTPKLAGQSGELTVDKVTQVSTWGAISKGTPVSTVELVAKSFTELLG